MDLCSDWLTHDKNVVKVNADSNFLFNSFYLLGGRGEQSV